MNPYYDEDGITIYHGDCREVLPALTADAIVTDPPFKLSQAYASNVDADNLDAVASLKDAAALMRMAVSEGALAAVFYDNRIMPFGIDAMRRAGWTYLRFLTLYRRWGAAHQLHGWMSTSDPVLLFAAPGTPPAYFGTWAHDVYTRDTPEPQDFGHPAQKPFAFVRQIVERITPPGGLVVDPYAGSGVTLAAAKASNRRAVGIEIEERYCEIAVQRLAQGVLPLEAGRLKGDPE